VIALSLAGEEPAIQAATTARVYKWIREWMNAGVNSTQFTPAPTIGADSLPGWIEEGFPESLHRHYDMDFVSSEGGMSTSTWMRDPYGASHNNVPSLIEHNGGHFTADTADYGQGNTSIPLDSLDISTPATRLANLENYEVMLQRIALGQYVPVGADVPFPTLLWKMSRAAQVARDYRRRNMFIYFNIAPVGFDIRDSMGSDNVTHRRLDTVVGHIPEASEQRAILNTALAYGNKGVHYQVLDAQTNVLGPIQVDRDSLREGVAIDWGSNGTLTSDTSQNKVSSIRFKQADAGGWYGDTSGYNILNLYTGWGNRSRETKQYNRWLKDSIGPLLMKLNWRDAYSIHHSVPQPYAIKRYKYRVVSPDQWDSVYYRSVGHRPLPSDEIITDVRSYRRDWIGTGANRHDTLIADSLTRTYVELGLFYRQNSTSSRLFDTNWAMVVNRRAFERPSDVPADSARGRLMDTLAEMRTITLKLNLLNFEQFNFVRVREMGADVTPLPLASGERPALDTVVHADSSIRLTLRAGGAALLRITYALPDTSLVAGRLPFSCQRKIVWDPDQRRYHSVYMMGTDSSRIDSVCYRRSVPMSDSNETILWEPDDVIWAVGFSGYALSRTNDINDSIVSNRHPSLTIRRSPVGAGSLPGTMVTVVWTAHRVPINYAARQVLLRTIWSPDGTEHAMMDMPVEVVDSAIQGRPENEWGTPVISRTDGADIIAWSDSLVGIKAVARVIRDPMTIAEWWRSPAVYTDTIHVSAAQTARFGRPGKYPSVPTFAHILSRDSNVAVVWEQARTGPVNAPTSSDICVKRLLHTVTPTADTLEALDSSFAVVNSRAGLHRHPSTTQHQSWWKHVQDQVVWEEESSIWPVSVFYVRVRSIFTETRSPSLNPPDIIRPKPELWGEVALVTRKGALHSTYPNIASLTYGDSADIRKGRATVAHNYAGKYGDTTLMAEASVQWADVDIDWRPYTYGGRYLSNSETPDSQRTRHAVLYEVGQAATRKLRTTREYYLGRTRPAGYLADGRQLAMRIDDSSSAGYSLILIDAWRADATEAAPIGLVSRDTSLRVINDLTDARSLLRTKYFSASDSTTIALAIAAQFDGDTTGHAASSMTYVAELVDSATGAVIHELDSFTVSPASPTRQAMLTADLDLVSGTYFIRVRVDTSALVVSQWTGDSRYPVAELVMFVEDSSGAFKLRRPRPIVATNMRVTAQPNPATNTTEARFTIQEAGRVRVILTDYSGRNTAVLVDEWMTPGRYALDLDTEGLAPGTYLVHVLSGTVTGAVKVLVVP
jgi:hypothetical protein